MKQSGALKTAASWGLVSITALVFALSFGLSYGVGNHNTYLLGGLRLARPDLLTNDWLASQTTNYHKFFSYPAGLLLGLDSPGWAFAIANVVMIIAGALIIFLLVDVLAGKRQRIPVFVLVLGMNLVTRTFSASGSYLYDRVFQPSTLGSTGLLVACYLFLRQRYLYSGLALAVGGLFHANFLLLGFPVFLVAHLLVSRERLAWRLIRQYAAPLVALALLLPTMLSVVGGPSSAKDILLHITSPFHYEPRSFWWEFLPLLGWLLLWLAVTPRREILTRKMRPGNALVVSLALLIGGATLLTTAVYLPLAAQAYVWRLCPLLLLLMQICVISAVIRPRTEEEREEARPRPVLERVALAVAVCALAAIYLYLERTEDAVWVALILLMALATVLLAPAQGWRSLMLRSRLVLGASLLAFAIVGGIALSDITERSSLLRSQDQEVQGLYDWARTTDVSAVFLIPPDMRGFRFAAQRAVVVDDRSLPFVPSEMVEWYSRLTAVSGGAGETAAGYEHLSGEQLEVLAERYSVSYVVLGQPVVSEPPGMWPVAYVNEDFKVLRVTPE